MQSADMMDDPQWHFDAIYLEALEKITIAWAGQLKANLGTGQISLPKKKSICFHHTLLSLMPLGNLHT
jgi:hypothetical protein